MTDTTTTGLEDLWGEVAPMRRTPPPATSAAAIDTGEPLASTTGAVAQRRVVVERGDDSHATGLNTKAISALTALLITVVAVAAVLTSSGGHRAREEPVEAVVTRALVVASLGPDARDHAADAERDAAQRARARAERVARREAALLVAAARSTRAARAGAARTRRARRARTPAAVSSRPLVPAAHPVAAQPAAVVVAKRRPVPARPAERSEAGGVCVDFPQACL